MPLSPVLQDNTPIMVHIYFSPLCRVLKTEQNLWDRAGVIPTSRTIAYTMAYWHVRSSQRSVSLRINSRHEITSHHFCDVTPAAVPSHCSANGR